MSENHKNTDAEDNKQNTEITAKIADKKPLVIELEAGDYTWCACGLSKNQPYCDGSHAGTGIEPIKFTLDEKKRVALCLCKQSEKAPFCDGSHKDL